LLDVIQRVFCGTADLGISPELAQPGLHALEVKLPVNPCQVPQTCGGHPTNVRVRGSSQAQTMLLHPAPVGVVQRHAHQRFADHVGITLTEGRVCKLPINPVGFLVAEGFGQPSLLPAV
jgi:hypothetical protein